MEEPREIREAGNDVIFDGEFRIPILYEDNHIIAVNKPAKVLAQADKTGDKPLLDMIKDYIKVRDAKPGGVYLGSVHRLDRPVSGLILFAKTSKAQERLQKMFRDRRIRKCYWAIVRSRPPQPEARLAHWLVKDPETNTVKAFEREVSRGMYSELDYRLVREGSWGYFLEVFPLTGRPHQIRVQLASMQCPIRGDKKYGAPKGHKDGSIALHARALSFIHPVRNEPVEILAPLPATSFWAQLKPELPDMESRPEWPAGSPPL